jgi:hypothetical protein
MNAHHRSPSDTLAAAIAAVPLRPLAPEDLITNAELRSLAAGDPARAMGEISIDDQALLALVLPHICGELIARRAAMAGLPFVWETAALTPVETLRALARDDDHRRVGRISPADQITLAMLLPDICNELRARRLVMAGGLA